MVGELAHAWDRFLGRLTIGRADGAFVRLSTPVEGQSLGAVRARLLSFRRELDGQLAMHWPVELGKHGVDGVESAGTAAGASATARHDG